ncbi:hypothetical protein AYJ57_22605 (plasmid) [Salipiger sp. CCB-MM3]|uniref:hypothetical protein n=1 Tax=Salipiger sp. CCB-MM3 TaxID=1792508 RepID=UPI00080AB66C|nr:hypothetical protein [Salipiger sp. CCB-MM3]ANT63269.1 hypothetical protein AYJ57_22605 [Salipiger sp. CCB-MM3]
MQIVSTSPFALIIFAAILWVGPLRGIPILFAAMPFYAAAAFNAPGLGSVSLGDIALIAMWLSFFLRTAAVPRALGMLRPGLPGFPLMMLMVVAGVGAIFLPRIFMGQTEVFAIGRANGHAAILLKPLAPSGANIGQFLRLLLVASAMPLLAAILARSGDTEIVMKAVIVATVVHLVISALDLISNGLGFPELLEFIRTSNYEMLDNQRMMNIRRMIGGFPEPSAYAYYTSGLYGFWFALWFRDQTSRLRIAMVVLTGLALLRSLSTAGMVNFVVFSGLFLVWHMRAAARERKGITAYILLTMFVPFAVGVTVVIFNFVPAIPDFIDTLVFNKMDSSSGEERMSWNVQAMQNFRDSYGLGLGIGSVRASSWIMANLGNLGIAGIALQAWFLLSLLTMGRTLRSLDTKINEVTSALKACCVAILLQALVLKTFPSLDLQFYAVSGMIAGLLIYQRRLYAGVKRADALVRYRHDGMTLGYASRVNA